MSVLDFGWVGNPVRAREPQLHLEHPHGRDLKHLLDFYKCCLITSSFLLNLGILFSCHHSSWTLNGSCGAWAQKCEHGEARSVARVRRLRTALCHSEQSCCCLCLEELTGGSVLSLHISEAVLKHLAGGQGCRGSLLLPLGPTQTCQAVEGAAQGAVEPPGLGGAQ